MSFQSLTFTLESTKATNNFGLFIKQHSYSANIDFPIHNLSVEQTSQLLINGINISEHFMALRHKLLKIEEKSLPFVETVIAVAMLINTVRTIKRNDSVISFSSDPCILGDFYNIIGEDNEFVLVDIDINDDYLLLVEIEDDTAIGLVRAKQRQLIKKM